MKTYIAIIAMIFLLNSLYADEDLPVNEQIRILLARAEEKRNYDLEKAMNYVKEAEKKAKDCSCEEEMSRVKYHKGIINSMQGNYKEAEKNFKSSLKITESTSDEKGMGVLHNALGKLYHFSGKYLESIRHLRKAIEIKEKLGEELDAAISYNNLGLTYIEITDYPMAMENCEKAYRMARRLNDTAEIINTGINVAIIYYSQKEYDKALEYNMETIKFVKEKDINHRKKIFNNIANIYMGKGDCKQAGQYYEKCLNINDIDKKMKSIVLLNLGNISIREKKYKEAEEFIRRSENIARETGDIVSRADATLMMSALYNAKGNYALALKTAEKALKVFRQKNIDKKTADAYKTYNDIYLNKKDYVNAYAYLEKYMEINARIKENEDKSFVEALKLKIRAEEEKSLAEKDLIIAKAENEKTKMFLIIVATMFLALVITMVSMLMIRNKKKKIRDRDMIIERKSMVHKMVYKKLSKEVNSILFGISVDITRMKDVETYNKFSASFNRLSGKYNELIDTMRMENVN